MGGCPSRSRPPPPRLFRPSPPPLLCPPPLTWRPLWWQWWCWVAASAASAAIVDAAAGPVARGANATVEADPMPTAAAAAGGVASASITTTAVPAAAADSVSEAATSATGGEAATTIPAAASTLAASLGALRKRASTAFIFVHMGSSGACRLELWIADNDCVCPTASTPLQTPLSLLRQSLTSDVLTPAPSLMVFHLHPTPPFVAPLAPPPLSLVPPLPPCPLFISPQSPSQYTHPPFPSPVLFFPPP